MKQPFDPTLFEGLRVLVTGGLGFIGSNLSIELAQAGADVTIVDAMIPGYGGNPFNIEPVADQVRVNYANITDAAAMDWLVRDQDVIFHLAGQVSHVLSLTNPYLDLDYNIKGTLVLAEACRRQNPAARIVFSGTRGQYGPAVQLPVREDAPTNPKGIYEISNLTAEKILKVYHDTHDLHTVMLRLTNVYGPRAQMRSSQYGVCNWFVRLLLDGEAIPVFGDGQIMRDFLYIEDCVAALMMAALADDARGEILNVGVDQPTTFIELVETMIAELGRGQWHFAPFSAERAAQEPGHFYSDITKIGQLVGWAPTTPLRQGLQQTFEYYERYREHYWTPTAAAVRHAA